MNLTSDLRPLTSGESRPQVCAEDLVAARRRIKDLFALHGNDEAIIDDQLDRILGSLR